MDFIRDPRFGSSTRIVKEYTLHSRKIRNSIISPGAIIGQATVEECILNPDVKIHDGVLIRRSIVLKGAVVRRFAHFEDAIIGPDFELFPYSGRQSPSVILDDDDLFPGEDFHSTCRVPLASASLPS